MARVTVTPERFEYVEFDAGHLTELATGICDAAGLGDVDVTIAVDELAMVPRVKELRVERPGSVAVAVTGAALEDAHRPRHVSDRKATLVLGLTLFRAADRLDPAFGEPPAEADLTLRQLTAWEASAEGRMERAGLPTRRTRRHYHFRLRHGFADATDGVFDRLWSATSPTWADIDAACAETAALDPGPLETSPA